jgi:hypothetical protein
MFGFLDVGAGYLERGYAWIELIPAAANSVQIVI